MSTAPLVKISITNLRKQFDRYVEWVLPLEGFVRELPRTHKHSIRFYEIVRALPSVEEYIALRDRMYGQSATDAVSDGVEAIRGLVREMLGWFGSLPTQIRELPKGEALWRAIEIFSVVTEPTPPSGIDTLGIRVVFLPDCEAYTMSARLVDAGGRLWVVVRALREKRSSLSEFQGDMSVELDNYAREVEKIARLASETKIPSALTLK